MKKQICKVCGGKLGSRTHVIISDIYYCLVDNQYHFPDEVKNEKVREKNRTLEE